MKKQKTRFQWNSTHSCHVCGVFPGFPCAYTCSRNGPRLGPSRPSRKTVRAPKLIDT